MAHHLFSVTNCIDSLTGNFEHFRLVRQRNLKRNKLKEMDIIALLIKYVPPFIAALILGNWFFKELQKARALKKPWYAPYLTTPAILIAVILTFLVVLRVMVV